MLIESNFHAESNYDIDNLNFIHFQRKMFKNVVSYLDIGRGLKSKTKLRMQSLCSGYTVFSYVVIAWLPIRYPVDSFLHEPDGY